ncbi:MAG: hypothetical protein L3J31_04490 [Bacteroidales bacterium]|nr:hypothetical protein [Bacteroidales bacterium]MCF6342044.1 hypothetical protein [Bacteroidales bacterium]
MGRFAIITAFILFGTLLSASLGYAQTFGDNVKTDKGEETEISLPAQQGFTPDVRVTMGTSFSSFGPGLNSFGTFIAPEISMPVTRKFSMQLGLGYSSMFYSVPGETVFSGNALQYGSVFVSGTYQVNEKLTVRGTGYKTFMLNQAPPGETANPFATDFSNQGVVLDVDYKVTEKFRIAVSFEYREQNSPSFYPYSPNGMNTYSGSPFRRNPAFGRGF